MRVKGYYFGQRMENPGAVIRPTRHHCRLPGSEPVSAVGFVLFQTQWNAVEISGGGWWWWWVKKSVTRS